MTRFASLVICMASALASVACASATHLTKQEPFPEKNGTGKTILIDAKQRAIVTLTDAKGSQRVCAEPSPDALSAIAASGGFSLSKGEAAALAANLSMAEGAGSIGLRTQSIQLMRDAMFRLCEGFVSGALPGPNFETLQRRFQSSMVAILAIEQLTGAVKPPAIVLGGKASSGNAELVAELTGKSEESRLALEKAESTVKAKNATAAEATGEREALEKEKQALEKSATTDEKEKAKEQARLKEIVEKLLPGATSKEKAAKTAAAEAQAASAKAQTAYDTWDAARQAALAGGSRAQVEALISSMLAAPQVAATTAAAVENIVRTTLQLEFGRELCATILTAKLSTDFAAFNKCQDYLNETVKALDAQSGSRTVVNHLAQTVVDLLKGPTPDPQLVDQAIKTLELMLDHVPTSVQSPLIQPTGVPPSNLKDGR